MMPDLQHLRDQPLEPVAQALGYQFEPRKRQWRRENSLLSINGAKFFDHLQDRGGGGAVDLVRHARPGSFTDAIQFLAGRGEPSSSPRSDQSAKTWLSVSRYLQSRALSPRLLEICRLNRILHADQHANAVLVCRHFQATVTGAEIVGQRPFKRLAKGTIKNAGGFWLQNDRRPTALLLVESAIDALSAAMLAAQPLTIVSFAGVKTRLPPWLRTRRFDRILCGFDADEAGDQAAQSLLASHPQAQHVRPVGAKDWNDLLQKRSRTAPFQPKRNRLFFQAEFIF